MDDNILGACRVPAVENSGLSRPLNKDCKEFVPGTSTLWLQRNCLKREEDLATMSSSLEEILSRVEFDEQRRGSVDKSSSMVNSPMPSTAHITPQLSAVMVGPPPGYDPILDDEQPQWRPPPYHLGFKLFVGALPYSVSEQDLYPLFSQFGEILELHVQRDWVGRSKGCAWLRYCSMEECDAAIEALHNNYYLGSMNRPMQLTFASEGLRSRAGTGDTHIGESPETVRPRAMTEDRSGSILSKLRMEMSESSLLPTTGLCAHVSDETALPVSSILNVRNLPADYSGKQVENLFSQFGSLVRLERISPSSATATYTFAKDAQRAKSTIEGVTLAGCKAPLFTS